MIFNRSKHLAEVLHEKSLSFGMEQFQIDIFLNGEKYRILIFNHDQLTPRRVIFAKVNQNDIPSSICVFREKSYIHQGDELLYLLNQLSETVIEEMLQSNGIYIIRNRSKSERFDDLLDRYNRYKDLAKIIKDKNYRKKAKRLKKLVERFVFKIN